LTSCGDRDGSRPSSYWQCDAARRRTALRARRARENLAHMEDIGLLGHLLAEAPARPRRTAGPDREATDRCAGAPSRRATRQRGADGCAVGPALRRGGSREGRSRARGGEHPPEPGAASRSLKATRPVGRPTSAGRKQSATSTRRDESSSSRFAPTSERAIASRTPSAPLASSARHAPHRASPVLPTRAPRHKALDRAARRARGRARLRARPHRSQRASGDS